MSLPLVTLPCTSCGAVAVQLRPPELSAAVRGFLIPLVKLASLQYGEPLELPKSGNLLELVEPAMLAQLVELRCYSCMLIVDGSALVAANGD